MNNTEYLFLVSANEQNKLGGVKMPTYHLRDQTSVRHLSAAGGNADTQTTVTHTTV